MHSEQLKWRGDYEARDELSQLQAKLIAVQVRLLRLLNKGSADRQQVEEKANV